LNVGPSVAGLFVIFSLVLFFVAMRNFSLLLLASAQLALAATIDVTVGGTGILAFNPSSVNANVGDVIRFTFHQKNHTVTQSSLATPCSPLASGFDSGFMPVADTQTNNFPVAELTVKQTTPIWAYCRQSTHCQSGMVFAVNPGNNFAAFQAAATGGASPSVSVSSAAAPTATTVPSSTDHRVVVGGTGVIAFNPPNITAQVGDTITFEFHQKNHTVTASSFAAPCVDLFTSSGTPGFDSGFMPVADGATTFPTYVVQVNTTNPIWAFCKQTGHCGQGMVFAANTVESSSKNFAAFQALAVQLNGTSSSANTTSTSPYSSPSSAAWRPAAGSSSIAVVMIFSAAVLLL
jgi:plastocyanin